jgi:hypothetical protein
LALSPEDKQVRDLFVNWAREAGCEVEVDPVGNIFARRPGTDPNLAPVAIGSHLDTQICGGRYDGVLGVMCGLETIRTLNDPRLPFAKSTAKGPRSRCAACRQSRHRFSGEPDGGATVKGVREFLVLLTLCETCRYKHLNFLDFLLSGSKSVDDFASRRSGLRRRRASLKNRS